MGAVGAVSPWMADCSAPVQVAGEVDYALRLRLRCNHTATHLLQAALKQVTDLHPHSQFAFGHSCCQLKMFGQEYWVMQVIAPFDGIILDTATYSSLCSTVSKGRLACQVRGCILHTAER